MTSYKGTPDTKPAWQVGHVLMCALLWVRYHEWYSHDCSLSIQKHLPWALVYRAFPKLQEQVRKEMTCLSWKLWDPWKKCQLAMLIMPHLPVSVTCALAQSALSRGSTSGDVTGHSSSQSSWTSWPTRVGCKRSEQWVWGGNGTSPPDEDMARVVCHTQALVLYTWTCKSLRGNLRETC